MTPADIPAVLVSTSVDSEAAAAAIADAVVGERLAACVHVAGPVASVYRWQGQVAHATEWTCQMKTTPERAEALVARIRSLHSYEIPEILVTPVRSGEPAYLAWIAEMTEPAR